MTSCWLNGEQREADKLKVGLLELPGTGKGLEARMPGQKTVLDLYGELVAAQDARESLQCGNHALYACCPQLWDSRLQEELGCKEDPMQVLDKLFSLAEQDQLGGQALRFLGLLPEPPQKTDGNDGEEKEEAQGAGPGIETVKTDRPRPSPGAVRLLRAPGLDPGGAEPDQSGGAGLPGGARALYHEEQISMGEAGTALGVARLLAGR